MRICTKCRQTKPMIPYPTDHHFRQSQPIHQLNPSDLKIPGISWTLEFYLGPGFLPQRTSQRNCLFHVAVFEDFSLSKQS